jgi:hypothetical protein
VHILSHTYCLPILYDLSDWFKAALISSQRWQQLCHHCELSKYTSYAIEFNIQAIQNTTEHSKHDSGFKCMFVGCTVLLLQFMNAVLFRFLYGLLIFNKLNSEKKLAEAVMFLQCRYEHFYADSFEQRYSSTTRFSMSALSLCSKVFIPASFKELLYTCITVI